MNLTVISFPKFEQYFFHIIFQDEWLSIAVLSGSVTGDRKGYLEGESEV